MATNEIEVGLVGKDRGLSRALKKGSADVHTFGGRLRLMGNIFKNLFTGHFAKAGTGLKTLGASFGKFGALAGIALSGVTLGIAALVAAMASLVVFVFKAKAAYEDWMGRVVEMNRLTGVSYALSSKLAGQFQLAGVEAKAGATGVFMFNKALDKARTAKKDAITGFSRLHISLKEADGDWRKMDDVLGEARDKLSAVKDAATRAAIGALLFGKGARTMLPWIVKSREEMAKFTKWLKDAGLIMGTRSVDAFKKYRQNQRHISVLWQGIKVNAYAALVPIINTLSGPLIGALRVTARWVARFRKLVEKKGWEKAIGQMVPQLQNVWDYLKKSWDAAKKFGAYIIDHKAEIVSAFEDILSVVNRIAGVVNTILDAWGAISRAASSAAQAGKGRMPPGYRPPDRAFGGGINGPASGYPIVAHGRETVVAHRSPSRGLADLAASGISGGEMTINVNVVVPGGTTLIGTAREVGEILAPHVERAVGRSLARSRRGR